MARTTAGPGLCVIDNGVDNGLIDRNIRLVKYEDRVAVQVNGYNVFEFVDFAGSVKTSKIYDMEGFLRETGLHVLGDKVWMDKGQTRPFGSSDTDA
jgi:hypothetical protein